MIFGLTITYTTSGFVEMVMCLVVPCSNPDGHLLDEIPGGYTFFMLLNGLQWIKCFRT